MNNKNFQTIKINNTEDHVILPLSEFKELMSKLKHSNSYIPSEVIDDITVGNHPVEAWRKYRGMTREQLAWQTGLSETQIYRIEKNKSKTKKGTLTNIANAVGAYLSNFVDPDYYTKKPFLEKVNKPDGKVGNLTPTEVLKKIQEVHHYEELYNLQNKKKIKKLFRNREYKPLREAFAVAKVCLFLKWGNAKISSFDGKNKNGDDIDIMLHHGNNTLQIQVVEAVEEENQKEILLKDSFLWKEEERLIINSLEKKIGKYKKPEDIHLIIYSNIHGKNRKDKASLDRIKKISSGSKFARVYILQDNELLNTDPVDPSYDYKVSSVKT